MGFDLSGLNPSKKVGEYFRANVWYWRPIAWFVLNNVELPSKETEFWGSNDGQKVSEKSSKLIASFISYAIKHKKEYKTEIEKWGVEQQNHPFDWGVIQEFREFCKYSGGFEIC